MGWWRAGTEAPAFSAEQLAAAATRVRETAHVVFEPARKAVGVAISGTVLPDGDVVGTPVLPILATLPPLYPEWLGDRSFLDVHRVRFPYVTGSMANGIATSDLVVAVAKAGMLGFFGAAGLPKHRVEQAIDRIEAALGPDGPTWGANLIHSPNEAALEMAVAALYLERGVRHVEASAFMALTPAVVRYACSGLSEDASGRIHRRNHVFAKVSRPEVATRFLSPAPGEMLDALVAAGHLTADEARLARRVPIAEDVTVESDSGGHTDNRPLGSLFPVIAALRDRLAKEHGYTRPIRVGAAGGLGTPQSVASAFALGAAYVMTGSVNQAAVESGLSAAGRELLAQADVADVTMAPAADMFELGVDVQVLKRGTMFAARGRRLYEIYKAHPSLQAIGADDRKWIEGTAFRRSIDDVWQETRSFWARRDEAELRRAESDPKHQMALCFRWYLGLGSRWAIDGVPERRADYQIWCGPAMGAFNDWTKGTFLAKPENRTVVQIARNLLEGAAVVTRAGQLRTFGAPVPPSAFTFAPRPLN
jgi:trans-AT polyketide synthase/acyltransferase/oxidoreductase domain-containing protein